MSLNVSYIFLFLLWPLGCSVTCYLIFIYLWIFQFSSYNWFLVSHCCDGKRCNFILNFINTCFWPHMWYCISWRMFYMFFIKICILPAPIGWNALSMSSSSGLMCSLSTNFLINFLSGRSILCWKWYIEVPHYYCIVVFRSANICLRYLLSFSH